jgi:hypothetical protein
MVNCDLYNWKDVIDKKINVFKSRNGGTTPLTLNNVYIRYSDTGVVQRVTNFTDRTSLTTTDRDNECKCTNVLEQVNYTYID